MEDDALLSTADAARSAGVAVSSVKRWADEGLLPCIRTVGGHRRFSQRDLESFLAHQERRDREGATGRAERWVAVMLQPDMYSMTGELYLARARLGAWHRVADELGSAITLLGDKWSEGEISIVEEHLASERVHRALTHISAGLTVSSDARGCLLATAEGDEHTLGLSLAELCLRESGWQALWAGRKTPTAEIVQAVQNDSVSLVALSASQCSNDRAKLSAQVRRVSASCRKRDIPLVLGGEGLWPEGGEGIFKVESFRQFHRLLEESWKEGPW
jgi:excisionase family DNA binding protein